MIKQLLSILLLSVHIVQGQNDSTSRFHVGFVYPLSSNGQFAQNFSNDASFHLIGGISANENAFCFSGISNIVQQNANGFVFSGIVNHVGAQARGVQFAGFSNIIKGDVEGSQFAGFNNISNNMRGLQLAGFSNISKGSVQGCQFAGFSNIAADAQTQFAGFSNVAKNSNGVQVAGFSNVSRQVKGLQLAGFSNIAKDVRGTQIAGFINIAKRVKGAQIAGFINIAKDVRGTQIAGFINIAKRVKGAQIAGFINIADSCEYPIGIINIIRKGDKSIGLSIDETGTNLLSFRSGSKKLYGIISAGYNFNQPEMHYGIEAGIGAHFPFNLLFQFNVEASVLTLSDFESGAFMKSSIRFLPSMRIGRNFEVFGGPTFSFSNAPSKLGDKFDISYVWSKYSNGAFYGMNIGAIGGVQYHF